MAKMRSMVVGAFNYDLFGDDIDLKKKLIAHANVINRMRRDLLVKSIVEIGGELKQAHDLICKKGCQSNFGGWVEAEFGFPDRTARRYMDAHKVLASLPVATQMAMSLEAVYALAHVPPEVLEKAIKLTDQGKVTLATIGPLLPKKEPEWRETWKPRSSTETKAVKDETMPCPNCGCVYWLEVEGGFDCSNCKHPQGEPVGDDEVNETLVCVQKIEEYASDIEAMRVGLDKQKTIAGEWHAFDDIQLELGKIVVELRRWTEHLKG